MSFIINPYAFGGGGPPPSDPLFDLIMADIGTYGGMYMRLSEASGTTAENEGGATEGTYAGTYTLGNTALYPGGPTSYRSTGTNGKASIASSAVPDPMTAMTVGCIINPAAISGLRHLVTRDVDSGSRYWQWRLNGSNMDFIKLPGGVESVTAAHGMTSATSYLAMVTVSSGGSVKLYVNGSQVGSTGTITGSINYGQNSSTEIVVGSRFNHNEATDNYYSECFVIAGELTGTRAAEYFTATGL